MSTLIMYNDIQIVSPDPTGPGGLAINNNFKTLSDDVAGALPLAGGTMSGPINMGAHAITNLATPTNPADAVTKNYVDGAIQGLQVKSTAKAATTGALPANTYNNGTAGVGATLTGAINGALAAIDGYTPVAGDLILVKDEATAANNGSYTLTTVGSVSTKYVLTRVSDMDSAGEFSGAFIPVGSAGAINANSLWLCNPSVPVTVGTTAIPFTELNKATDLVAGTNILISGNTISAPDVLPLAGGTMSGAINMGGQTLNMNTGGGSGGQYLKMDGGWIIDNSAIVYYNGSLYYSSSAQLTSSHYLHYSTGNVLTDGISLYYPDGTNTLADSSGNLCSPNSSRLADGYGNLYYTNGSQLADTVGGLYGDGSNLTGSAGSFTAGTAINAGSGGQLYYYYGALLTDSSGNLYYNGGNPLADDNGRLYLNSYPPASSSSAGNAGVITWDANYIYVCVAANTWVRAALSTW